MLAREYQVLAAETGELEEATQVEIPDDRMAVVKWNPGSAISSRSLLVEGSNTFGGIDEAILIFTPERNSKVLHDIPAADINGLMERKLSGYIHLTKELIRHFQKKGGGRIVFIIYNPDAEILSPLDNVTHGGFKSFVDSLFEYYKNESFQLFAFHSEETAVENYLDFIFKQLDERKDKIAGKWTRYSEKNNLLSLLRLK